LINIRQSAKTSTYPLQNAGSDSVKITVAADKNRTVHVSNGGHDKIGTVYRHYVTQQNDGMSMLAEN